MPISLYRHQAAEVILASKLIEVVPNVEGLVIVPSILVVNELYISCKEKQHYLDRDTGSRDKMIVLIFPFHFILLLFVLSYWTCGYLAKGGARSKSLYFEGSKTVERDSSRGN